MSTFFSEDDHDFHFNACVGVNVAGDNSYGYKWGFEQAVSILSSVAITGEFYDPTTDEEQINEYACLDVVIYPICFCARHFIELFIKHHTKIVISLLEVKSKRSYSNGKSHGHNLNGLFDNLKELASVLDSRVYNKLVPIFDFISDFSKVDPTGEVFRYHSNKDNELHLVDVPRISVRKFYERFKELKSYTDYFDHFMDAISEEYRQGTFTKNLSRYEIGELSKLLPPFNSWHDKVKMKRVKSDFANKYRISIREVDEAIKKIRDNFEFSANIQVEKTITSISLDSISLIVGTEGDWSSLTEISDSEWQCLSSIIECGVGPTYCESYQRNLERAREEYIDKNYIGLHISVRKSRFLSGLENLYQSTIIAHYENCIRLKEDNK